MYPGTFDIKMQKVSKLSLDLNLSTCFSGVLSGVKRFIFYVNASCLLNLCLNAACDSASYRVNSLKFYL